MTIFFKASITDKDLQIFVAEEWVSAACLKKIIEQHLKECVRNRCGKDETGWNLFVISEAVAGGLHENEHEESKGHSMVLTT